MITTTDNPYNPYEDFDLWYHWDVSHGYNTCAYVARVYALGAPPRGLMPWEEEMFMRQAESEVIKMNLTGRYVRAVDPNPQLP